MTTLVIDLSGGKYHWLSPAGRRPANDAIHMKHRDRYLAEIKANPKPVSEATLAKLREIDQRNAPPELAIAHQLEAWSKAVIILDASEIMIRDLIETALAGITDKSLPITVGMVLQVKTALLKKIAAVRMEAVKTAFRLVRENLGDKPILNLSLSRWAAAFVRDDLRNIEMAISSGLTEGLDSMEIARKIVGSLALNGVDGVTQYTRLKVAHLGRAGIKESKLRARKPQVPVDAGGNMWLTRRKALSEI